MNTLQITDLFIYPVKSTFRISLNQCVVEQDGFEHDRRFAIINEQGRIITARENNKLFKIKTKINADHLMILGQEELEFKIDLKNSNIQKKEVTIFKDLLSVKLVDHEVNAWLSNILEESAQLVCTDEINRRMMKLKYNGKETDSIGFKDASAIHLISEDSVKALNEQLDEPVSIDHFRPNIVIKGIDAYAEDNWKKLKIGDCQFDVAIKTARCPMININPNSQEININKEPLKTLAKTRSEDNKVNFGIYLIPRKLGHIKLSDRIVVD